MAQLIMSNDSQLVMTGLSSNMDSAAVPADATSDAGLRSWLDRIGISASLLCAVHCLAAPFLLLLLPAAGSVWSHPAVHWVLAVFVVPLALWVLYNGYRKHGSRLTLVAATAGALLIVAGLIAPMVHSEPVLRFTVPAFFGESGSAASSTAVSSPPIDHATTDPVCTDTCCPTITHDAATGASLIAMPPGGLLTLLGSVLLVLAHTSNLIACRCFSKTVCDDAACGCPA